MEKIENLMEEENVALVKREYLKPVEGDDAIIFPPTYAEIGYNIDSIKVDDKTVGNVCLIDSVGSQANRMEPIFKAEPYSSLIPQIHVEIQKKVTKEVLETVDILDAGHRIADAVIRFSNIAEEIKNAFLEAKKGNKLPLAKLAPTSFVFGCWDSRDTGVKIPRIVRSTIRAHNVSKLTRSATYFVPTDYYTETGAISGKDAEEAEKASAEKPAKASTVGLANALANKSHGGVLLSKDSILLRESVLSLSALRQLKGNDDETENLLKYILGLSLVAITAPQDHLLRMGCELTTDPEKKASWSRVKNDGTREDITLNHSDILKFAQDNASKFGIGKSQTAIFDPNLAQKALEKAKK